MSSPETINNTENRESGNPFESLQSEPSFEEHMEKMKQQNAEKSETDILYTGWDGRTYTDEEKINISTADGKLECLDAFIENQNTLYQGAIEDMINYYGDLIDDDLEYINDNMINLRGKNYEEIKERAAAAKAMKEVLDTFYRKLDNADNIDGENALTKKMDELEEEYSKTLDNPRLNQETRQKVEYRKEAASVLSYRLDRMYAQEKENPKN